MAVFFEKIDDDKFFQKQEQEKKEEKESLQPGAKIGFTPRVWLMCGSGHGLGLGAVTSGESVFLYGTLKTVFLSADAFAKGLLWFDKLTTNGRYHYLR